MGNASRAARCRIDGTRTDGNHVAMTRTQIQLRDDVDECARIVCCRDDWKRFNDARISECAQLTIAKATA